MSFLKRLTRTLSEHPGHLVWILAAYVPWLGAMSVPLTGDQKVYISTSMEMRQAGAWLQPILFGQPSYYKPPFQYWMTMLGWKVFGFNLWGTLLPSVFAVLATAWLLGEILRIQRVRKRFIHAGLAFAAALGTVTYGCTSQMEIYLCLFLAVSWWAALKFLSAPAGERRFGWLYLAFAVAGLSAINKSPLYSVLWVVSFLSYLGATGEWALFKSRRLYVAWGLGALVGLAWYAALFAIDPHRFFSDYLIRETWAKNSGNDSSFAALWVALAYFSFPVTLLLIPGLRAAWRGRRRDGGFFALVISWSWVPAIFFSAYPYRIKPYLYVLVPVVAMLANYGFCRRARERVYRRFLAASGALLAVAMVALALVASRSGLAPGWLPWALLLTGAFAIAVSLKGWAIGFMLSGLAAVLCFRVIGVAIGEDDLRGLREAVAASPSAPVAMLDPQRNIWHEVGLLSVGIGKPIERLMGVDQVGPFVESGGLVILTEIQAEELGARLAENFGGRLKSEPWSRWKVRAHFPYKDFILKGRAGIPDFEERTRRIFRIVRLQSGP